MLLESIRTMTAQKAVDYFSFVIYTLGLLELLIVYIIKVDRLDALSKELSRQRHQFDVWQKENREYSRDYADWSRHQGFRGALQLLDQDNPEVARKVRELLDESAEEGARGHEIDRINAIGDAYPDKGQPNPHYAESDRLEREARELAASVGAEPTPAPKPPKLPLSGKIYLVLTAAAVAITMVSAIVFLYRLVPSGGFHFFSPEVARWWHVPIALLMALAFFLAVWVAIWAVWMSVWLTVSSALAISMSFVMKLVGWLTAESTLVSVFHILFFASLAIDTIELGIKLFSPS
ncbi:MAG: hypothetical protein DI562_06780 [Stenotrophomonas acidaminiphila]|nr:MAG: hypothetical protein DI562_06780 [Stenotrophomonas acidaminiphila]